MSDRYRDYKGSSRSSRDDYRKHKEREGRTRSRSRSPMRRRPSPPGQSSLHDRPSQSRGMDIENKNQLARSQEWEGSDDEVPAPPPPPRISKISIGFTKPKAPIKMTLGAPSKSVAPKPTLASVFNPDDDDDEPEEMPAEAKMRMRNIGRETPTSAGPNSFGKTKQGFCDAKKVFEKNLKQALETADKPAVKFPQTIYKIKGP